MSKKRRISELSEIVDPADDDELHVIDKSDTSMAPSGTNKKVKVSNLRGDASPLTTKGDLYGHDGTDGARIPVGADGSVATADSAAPAGISWEPAGAPGPHDFGGASHTPDTLANVNTRITDATLDDAGDPRDPNAHEFAGAEHTASTLAAVNSKISDATLVGYGDVVRISSDGTQTPYPAAADTDLERGNALETAVADMQTGDVLILGPGVFHISFSLEVTAGALVGSGPSTVIKGTFGGASTAYPLIVTRGLESAAAYNGVDGLLLSDFAVDATDAAFGFAHARNIMARNILGLNVSQGTAVGHFFDIVACEHVTVNGCTFRGSCTGAGVFQIDRAEVGSLQFQRSGGAVVNINADDTPSRVVTLDGNVSEFTNSDGGDNRIHFELHRKDCRDITISNNVCTDGRQLVRFEAAGGHERIAIVGNTFRSADTTGSFKAAISVAGTRPTALTREITVVGNTLEHSQDYSVWVLDSDGVSITGNTFKMNRPTGTNLIAVHLQDAVDCVVSGNVIQGEAGAGSDGILCQTAGTAGHVITGNKVSGFENGIVLGTGTSATVTGNVFRNVTTNYSGSGTFVIEDRPDGELSQLPNKAAPVAADVIKIEDSENGGSQAHITVGDLPGGGGGEANDGANVGGATGQVFRDKTGVDLNFKTFRSSDASVVITNEADTINLQATGAGGGEANTQTNQGGGVELGLAKNGADLPIRTLDTGQFETNGNQVRIPAGTFSEPGDPPTAHALGGAEHTADTLANLNAKVSDATLDDSGDPRPPTAHTHAAGDVTSGTFADARIAESNVTQHEGAIDHNALTNYESGRHVKNNMAVSAPTVNNDSSEGYAVGSRWTDSVGGVTYFAQSVAVGAAVWVEMANKSDLDSHTGDSNNPHGTGMSDLSDYDANNNTIANVSDGLLAGEAVNRSQLDTKADDSRVGNGTNGHLIHLDGSNNHIDSGIDSADVTANTLHRGVTSGNPHSVGLSELSDTNLSAEVTTRDNDIVISTAAALEQARVGFVGSGGFLARTSNNDYDPNDGGVSVQPGKIEIHGSAIEIASQTSIGEVRDVNISADGQLFFPKLPASGWTEFDTDTGVYDAGGGTGLPVTWVRLTGLEITLPAEFTNGDRVDVAYSLYVINNATNSNGSGILEIGFGINDATPTAVEQTILIPFLMDSYVSGGFTVPSTTASPGDTVDIFVRAGNGGHGTYQVDVDGSTNEHTLTVSSPSAGGGSGDVTGPAGGVVDDEITLFSGTSGKQIKGSGVDLSEIDPTVFDGGTQTGNFTPDRANGRIQKFALSGAAGVQLGVIANTTEGQSGRIELDLTAFTGALSYAGGYDIGGADNPLPNASGSTVLLGWDHGAGGRIYLTGFGSEDAT